MGRPRAEVNRRFILKLRAKGLGYGAIARLHVYKYGFVSASTVRRILKEEGK